MDIARIERDIPPPASEPTVRVDSVNPFGEEHPLGLVALGILTLGLEHKHVTRQKADQEIGPVFPHHAFVDVEHLEAEVVVLYPGGHLGSVV